MTTLWTGRCASRGVAVLGAGIALVMVAIGIGSVIALNGSSAPAWIGWVVALVGIVVGLSGWLFSSLVVRVTEDTLTVAYGPYGLPRRVIALAEVAEVSAIMVDPIHWGGWGYRWIPWAHASAAVIRKGPGIALELKDGRRFTVTVDDAVNGAKLASAALIGAGRD